MFRIVVALFLIVISSQLAVAQRADVRDLAKYIDGRKYDLKWQLPDRFLVQEKIRKFIWDNWSAKRLARIEYKEYSVEGDPTVHKLFIEPNKRGEWVVVNKYDNICCWFYYMQKPRKKPERRTGTLIYTRIIRHQPVRNPEGFSELGMWRTPGDDEVLDANSYMLLLQRKGTDDWELVI